MNTLKAKKALEQFFLEDMGDYDVSTGSIFREDDMAEGTFLVKGEGVLSGTDLIKLGYSVLGYKVDVTYEKGDGDHVAHGDIIARVKGPVTALLTAERVILNLMQRMSGIATATKEAVTQLNSEHTRVCDTRKTMPGLRMFDKYAVTCGGGYNHRFGLYDGVMLKDNHIAHAGSITKAVQMVKGKVGHMVKIEVETETKEQVIEAVEAGAHIIMFDNRTPAEIKEYMRVVPSHVTTEASGGIGLHHISNYGTTGVDYISLGCLTHSVQALDISFNIKGIVKR